jgi:hypothetical protein
MTETRSLHKSNSKWIADLNETLKLLQESVAEILKHRAIGKKSKN